MFMRQMDKLNRLFLLQFLFSYVFYPFAFMMGAKSDDCLFIGELLGVRTISLAIVAYPKLGPIIQVNIVVLYQYTLYAVILYQCYFYFAVVLSCFCFCATGLLADGPVLMGCVGKCDH
jgi:nucleoside permease NupC